MAKRITKDEYFRRAFEAGKVATELFDVYFLGYPNNDDDSSMLRVFGTDYIDGEEEYDEQSAKSGFRETPIWHCFDELFDYVIEGILPEQRDADEVIYAGGKAWETVPREQAAFGEVVEELLSAARGRVSLDNGEDIELAQLAYLANIDERSVRNAISAAELAGSSGKPVFINNQSARTWLQRRRGYRPTQLPSEVSDSFTDIKTPAEFSVFLKSQYKRLNPNSEIRTALPDHSAISGETLELLEAGVFNLPLDVCPILAAFYQIDRQAFLATVMKVFYEEELRSLTQVTTKKRG